MRPAGLSPPSSPSFSTSRPTGQSSARPTSRRLPDRTAGGQQSPARPNSGSSQTEPTGQSARSVNNSEQASPGVSGFKQHTGGAAKKEETASETIPSKETAFGEEENAEFGSEFLQEIQQVSNIALMGNY